MVKNCRIHGRKKRPSSSPQLIGEQIFALLQKMGGKRDYCDVALLWRNWDEVMGEVAQGARPCGHNERTLVLEVDDSMQMQELHFKSGQVLAQANAFLRRAYFDKLRLELKGRAHRTRTRISQAALNEK